MSAKSIRNIFLIIFIAVFAISNGVLIIFLLTKQNINTTSNKEYTINEYVDDLNNPVQKLINQSITSNDNFTLIEDNFQIYATNGSAFEINYPLFRLTKGTLLISGENLTLEQNGHNFQIQNTFTAIWDFEDGLILIDGEGAFNGEILNLNAQIVNAGNEVTIYEFERKKLDDDKYKALSSFLTQLNMLPEYFSDTLSPEIISISPRDGFTTNERYIRMYGYTEPNIDLILNSEAQKSDLEGYFTKQIDLEVGDNPINLSLKDKFGNKKLIVLNYIRKGQAPIKPVSSPVSYPISFPN